MSANTNPLPRPRLLSPSPTVPPLVPLDERQRRLISLLLAGHTDSSAAHRLGISARTVTNILRSLMDRLGVDNRFQLGVALGIRMRPAPSPARRPVGPGLLLERVHDGSPPAQRVPDRRPARPYD
ncbi:helix-turn-helix transcriptional regulator [Streptomyces sp. NPDC017673]|uniref:helix-turn-helix domain-containing protein n=1 Tax=unclassified Streptomyces TaxID=2593676 RepID=UPI0037AAD788